MKLKEKGKRKKKTLKAPKKHKQLKSSAASLLRFQSRKSTENINNLLTARVSRDADEADSLSKNIPEMK